jgi:hypothetical protein
MSWGDIGELIKVLGAVATAGAAWVAVRIAYQGLEKWRSETTGKRKADLAATALAMVYQAEEIFRNARSTWIPVHEMIERPGIPEEIAKNPHYVAEARLLEHQDFFSRLRSLRHEFAAVFNQDDAKMFDELWRVRLDINHAVGDMLRNKEMEKSSHANDLQLWNEWKHTAYVHPKPEQDEVLKRIKAQVAAAEKICRPAIAAREGSKGKRVTG